MNKNVPAANIFRGGVAKLKAHHPPSAGKESRYQDWGQGALSARPKAGQKYQRAAPSEEFHASGAAGRPASGIYSLSERRLINRSAMH